MYIVYDNYEKAAKYTWRYAEYRIFNFRPKLASDFRKKIIHV